MHKTLHIIIQTQKTEVAYEKNKFLILIGKLKSN